MGVFLKVAEQQNAGSQIPMGNGGLFSRIAQQQASRGDTTSSDTSDKSFLTTGASGNKVLNWPGIGNALASSAKQVGYDITAGSRAKSELENQKVLQDAQYNTEKSLQDQIKTYQSAGKDTIHLQNVLDTVRKPENNVLTQHGTFQQNVPESGRTALQGLADVGGVGLDVLTAGSYKGLGVGLKAGTEAIRAGEGLADVAKATDTLGQTGKLLTSSEHLANMAPKVGIQVSKPLAEQIVKPTLIENLTRGIKQTPKIVGVGEAYNTDQNLKEGFTGTEAVTKNAGKTALIAGGLHLGIAGGGAGIRGAKNLISPTEEAVTNAQKKIAESYEKTLPLTPTQQIKEANLLEKTGDNVYTILAKHNINLGSKEAYGQIQKVSDKFESATNKAKNSEHAYFSVNEIKQNAEQHIDETIPSETARRTAKAKVNAEIDAIVESNPKATTLDANGNVKINSDLAERLRKTGNSWTPFNASDPEKVGRSSGYALSNAVRDQVEKEGTFPSYREANKEWGKILRAQEMLNRIEDSGKSFRVPGGLSASISRRILSGALGFQTGGIGGMIASEIGSESLAKIMANPEYRTWFNRKIVQNAGAKQTPEVIARLSKEVEDYIKKSESRLRLPAPRPLGSAENPHIMGGENKTTFEAPAKTINREKLPPLLSLPQRGQTSARIPLLGKGEARSRYEKSVGLDEVKNAKINRD